MVYFLLIPFLTIIRKSRRHRSLDLGHGLVTCAPWRIVIRRSSEELGARRRKLCSGPLGNNLSYYQFNVIITQRVKIRVRNTPKIKKLNQILVDTHTHGVIEMYDWRQDVGGVHIELLCDDFTLGRVAKCVTKRCFVVRTSLRVSRVK